MAAGGRVPAPGALPNPLHFPPLTVPVARCLACCVRVALLGVALAVAATLPAWAEPASGRLPRHVVPLRHDVRLVLDPAVEAFTGTVDIFATPGAFRDPQVLARALSLTLATFVAVRR